MYWTSEVLLDLHLAMFGGDFCILLGVLFSIFYPSSSYQYKINDKKNPGNTNTGKGDENTYSETVPAFSLGSPWRGGVILPDCRLLDTDMDLVWCWATLTQGPSLRCFFFRSLKTDVNQSSEHHCLSHVKLSVNLHFTWIVQQAWQER